MRWLFLALLLFASAGPAAPALTRKQAISEDAVQYAAKFGVPVEEAVRRLRAQEASVEETNAIAREFAGRVAGISIEHAPEYRIVILLTGAAPVTPRTVAGVPVVFRTGAIATHDQANTALKRHLSDLRADLANPRGAG